MLSETDTTGGGDVSADENTVDNSRPSSRQGNFTTSSKDGKEEKDEKEEKGKDRKAAVKHRRGNSIMDLFKFKVRSFYSLGSFDFSRCDHLYVLASPATSSPCCVTAPCACI